jgi:hypothetical protein
MGRLTFRSLLKEPGAEGSVPPCLMDDMTQQNLNGIARFCGSRFGKRAEVDG